jgi:hypothetical protein
MIRAVRLALLGFGLGHRIPSLRPSIGLSSWMAKPTPIPGSRHMMRGRKRYALIASAVQFRAWLLLGCEHAGRVLVLSIFCFPLGHTPGASSAVPETGSTWVHLDSRLAPSFYAIGFVVLLAHLPENGNSWAWSRILFLSCRHCWNLGTLGRSRMALLERPTQYPCSSRRFLRCNLTDRVSSLSRRAYARHPGRRLYPTFFAEDLLHLNGKISISVAKVALMKVAERVTWVSFA